MVSLPDGEKISKIGLFVLTWSTNVTDGQRLRHSKDHAYASHRRCRHRVVVEDRSVAPVWPRRMAACHRSAGGRWWSWYLQKGIITPTDLLQPKDETKKAETVASNTDPSKYAHLKGIRTNPKTVKIHDLETDSVTVFPSAYKVYRALGIYPSFIRDGKVWKGRYMINVCW